MHAIAQPCRRTASEAFRAMKALWGMYTISKTIFCTDGCFFHQFGEKSKHVQYQYAHSIHMGYITRLNLQQINLLLQT